MKDPRFQLRFTKKIILLFLCCFVKFSLQAQNKFTLSGVIKDTDSGETLIGVNVIDKDLKIGTVSNEYGFFSFTLEEGIHKLQISYLGYTTLAVEVNLTEDIRLNFNLVENTEALDEAVVTAYTEKISIQKAEMSVNKMKVATIKAIPAVLGEVDVLKSITTLPGVTTAGEGQSGFNVRGGAADQNLVLLDEAILFNTSHLFGLFSVINADAIKDLKLYKGGIPAKFGGRIASVLDIHQKDGNKYEFHGNGGIGLISSRLTLEGPIKTEKASFFLSGRRSYADLFLPLAFPDNENKAFFYDLNTKANWEINKNNKLYLSGYFGKDIFSLSDSFINSYGNAVANLRWNHVFSSNVFSNLSVIYSNYYYNLELDFVGFEWNSGLQNFNFQYDLTKYMNEKTSINFGLNTMFHEFNPGKISPSKASSRIKPNQLPLKYGVESGGYIDVEQKLNEKIDLRYGLRFSSLVRLGEKSKNSYAGSPVLYDEELKIYSSADPIDQKDLSRRTVQKAYGNIEPRFSIAYSLTGDSSIKASYQRTTQYLHLTSNTQSPTPLDIWTPSGEYIKPQLSNQIALGYNRDFGGGQYTFTAEVFGKNVQNRLDYIDGADLIANDAVESIVLAGNARAYGLELLFKKEWGKLDGWISYTLSRSEQQTSGRTPSEVGINNGDWYATGHDKTNDLSVVANYKASKKWTFNANFSFQTGQPITYPVGGNYEQRGIVVPAYDGKRNASRLPSYHRLDVSAVLKPKRYQNRRIKGEWVFSVYNLYNRQNWSSVIFGQDLITSQNKTERLTLFGALPSVTFNFKF